MTTIPIGLRVARTRLVLGHPFIGALVLHLPLVPVAPGRCSSVASDGRAIYFNPDYAAGLTPAQARFVLAHVALHCALGHFARRAGREQRRWDAAADHAVNLLLLDEGLEAPPGVLADPRFRGLAAEEIYALIPPGEGGAPLDMHLGAWRAGCVPDPDGGVARSMARAHPLPDALDAPQADEAARGAGGQSPAEPPPVAGAPIAATDADAVERLWQAHTVTALQQARAAGRGGGSLLRAVEATAVPVLPWRALLARFVLSAARADWSFQRPSRRDGDALLPRLAGSQPQMHVVLDTSGSITPGDLSQFACEIDALKAQLCARLTLHACDERLDPRGPWTFEPWEPVVLPTALAGGAGTSFRPVFDWIEARRERPDVLVYFTDAEGEFPERAPDFPVLWVVNGNASVPWGARIGLDGAR